MEIEKLATAAIEDSISKTDTMNSFINTGDKEPSWDGNIYIYANNKKSKDDIKKVPVQVKGKKCNKQDKETIKYSVEVTHLKNYLIDGGVMFFVVYIDDTGNRKQIYYSELLPIRLRLLLKEIGEQKYKSIELKKFPEDNNEKTAIFLNFYNNMKKQTSFVKAKLFSEEELMKKGILEGITTTILSYGTSPKSIRDIIFQSDVYLYAKIKGTDVQQPLEKIPLDLHLFEDENVEVSVKGKKYYDCFRRIITKKHTKIIIGKSLFITIEDINRPPRFDFKPTNILKDALVDLPFILDAIEHKQMEIAGLPIYFSCIQGGSSKNTIQTLKDNLNVCKRVNSLFDILSLDKNYDLTNFAPKDWKIANTLVDALVDEKPITGLKEDIPYITWVKFIYTKIALVFRPGGSKGTYYITDYFKDVSFKVYNVYGDVEKPTSKFATLIANVFLEFCNVNYEEIIKSFLQYSDEPHCFDEANNVLLEMILAYDRSKDTRMDILNYAKQFADVIDKNIAKGDNIWISKLNMFQIEKRFNALTKEQRKELVGIEKDITLDNKNYENMIKLGVNLLLENQEMAEYYFERLDEETKKNCKEFPIFRFWKDTTEDDNNGQNENGNA